MNKYDPGIIDYIEREVNILPFNLCRIDVLEKPDYNNPPMGCFSLDKDGTPVAQFYTEVIRQNINLIQPMDMVKQGGVQKFIQRVVRHECRHYMQYEYFLAHGIEYNHTLDIENKFQYGEGPLEKDAKDFANGIVNDLAELVEKYYTKKENTSKVEKPVVTIEDKSPTSVPLKKKKRRKK